MFLRLSFCNGVLPMRTESSSNRTFYYLSSFMHIFVWIFVTSPSMLQTMTEKWLELLSKHGWEVPVQEATWCTTAPDEHVMRVFVNGVRVKTDHLEQMASKQLAQQLLSTTLLRKSWQIASQEHGGLSTSTSACLCLSLHLLADVCNFYACWSSQLCFTALAVGTSRLHSFPSCVVPSRI